MLSIKRSQFLVWPPLPLEEFVFYQPKLITGCGPSSPAPIRNAQIVFQLLFNAFFNYVTQAKWGGDRTFKIDNGVGKTKNWSFWNCGKDLLPLFLLSLSSSMSSSSASLSSSSSSLASATNYHLLKKNVGSHRLRFSISATLFKFQMQLLAFVRLTAKAWLIVNPKS